MHQDTLWMTAIEKRYAAIRANSHPGENREVVQAGADYLKHAETYAFTAETATAIYLASRSVPGDSVVHVGLMPCPSAWWWFEQPLPVRLHPKATAWCALSWEIYADHVGLFGWTPHREFGHPPMMTFFEQASPQAATVNALQNIVDRDLRSDPIIRAGTGIIWRFLLAGLTWLQQRIAVTTHGHVERHARKRLEREYHTPIPSTVKVVQLRRTEHAPHQGGNLDVQWSCRWVVSGHWRNQPYKDNRKLIYILPYIKGPADQPLRIPSQTVYLVSR